MVKKLENHFGSHVLTHFIDYFFFSTSRHKMQVTQKVIVYTEPQNENLWLLYFKETSIKAKIVTSPVFFRFTKFSKLLHTVLI